MKPGVFLAAALLLAAPSHAAEPAIKTFGPDSFTQIAAAAKGQPQVVMVWSLDCSYCEPSFAALAGAQRRGAKVVTIATDPVEDGEARTLIRRKLAKSGLHAETWAFGSAPADLLRHAIDPAWRGEMPRSYWFDGKGQVRAYSGLITPERVAAMLPN
nr:hypothetical protein [uncultured Noviherbaspirillum sp.]